ncbi:hypothetical protein Nepgr_012225 [Nepenthes gracilis]|uniref:Peptidase A1 domain-containing protein n=1 Tax=Nepenthes gracilis TaxID=150966 RepID=A0AAD3SGW7_NEPGR|nr:hypothetical protein Nepgr_012225 [Nepenthes gracilis]
MASSLYSFIIPLAIAFIFVTPPTSTSKISLNHEHEETEPGFRVMLKRVDAGKNLTTSERIRRALQRDKKRLQTFRTMTKLSSSGIEAPVFPGPGEFLMQLAIGTPPQYYPAIMDTGSDLIWTQCSPCVQCFSQPTPVFDPSKSDSFESLSCSSKFCQDLQSACIGNCYYTYAYGDSSFTIGYMATETFAFNGSGSPVSVQNIAFGCGEFDQGTFTNCSGLVGMGRGPLSLPSQLPVSTFSYCLTSTDSSNDSTLYLGPSPCKLPQGTPVTSTLVKNIYQPSFYYFTLTGISVGATRLDIPSDGFAIGKNGTNGIIIDSGTTLTYIPSNYYDMVKDEFVRQTKLTPFPNSTSLIGLDCYELPQSPSTVQFPILVFHFDGGDLRVKDYLITGSYSNYELVCLAMGSSDTLGISIFGNIMQVNKYIVYDLEREVLTFIPTNCNGM